MKEVESRRRVPVAVLSLICVSIIGIFQVLLVTGAYKVDAGVVRKIAPFLYNPFRKVMGEHPSTRPKAVDLGGGIVEETEVEVVTGLKSKDLSISIDGPKSELPEEVMAVPKVIIPVSEPEKPNLLDSDKPVG